MNLFSQIKILTKLELCNLYGLNTLRFTKDTRAKRKALWLLAAWIMVLVILFFYIGALSYGLIRLNLQKVVPSYLIAIASMLTFFFGILKSGSFLFRQEGYDCLSSMPVYQSAFVISRLIKIYTEYLTISFGILLPGIAVYIWKIHPQWNFYGTLLLSVWAVPLLPIAASVFIGALISGISSRMRHKSLVTAALSVLSVFAVLYGSSRLTSVEENILPEMLYEMSELIFYYLGKIYPPAVWLGKAIVQGDIIQGLFFAVFSLLIFAPVTAAVSFFFRKICDKLFSRFARHNYKLGKLKEKSVLTSLCGREFKRYFSSGIYVTNTIIGPIMGCVLSGMLLVSGPDFFKSYLPFSLPLQHLIPFLTAGIFTLMSTTSTSVSMEGKCWWLVKSLPLSTKEILDAKILMNILLIFPFYLFSEVLLTLALKPGLPELFWQLLIPALIIVFSCIYGISVNLHFPVFEWESETYVVKQSASAILGGLGGFLLSIACIVAVMVTPEKYFLLLKSGICIFVFMAALLLYLHNNRYDLSSISS